MITGLSHVSMVVPDLAQAIERLQQVYGITAGEPMTNAQQGVRLAYVELIQPEPSNAALMRFLDKHPQGGLHHVALHVDSMAATRSQLSQHGVVPISAPEAQNVHGESIAFIHPKDFLGALLELEEKA